MTFTFEQPPAELTWYHLGSLLAADAGTLKYDQDRYRVHGVPNNAAACCWCGLLTDSDDGLVLTDLGRTLLTGWKASPKGQAWLAEQAASGHETSDSPAPAETASPAASSRADQLDLFATT